MFRKGGIPLTIVIAIILALICSQFFLVPPVRVSVTFNAIFGQFLGFYIPLVVISPVTPVIADFGSGPAKWLGLTALIAYISTLYSGFLTYGTITLTLPKFPHQGALAEVQNSSKSDLAPSFIIAIGAVIPVMGALILSLIMGIGLSLVPCGMLRYGFVEFRKVITRLIERVIIPLLPLRIFGIFLNMTKPEVIMKVIVVLLTAVVLVLVLGVVILVTQYLVDGLTYGVNPLKALLTMPPAYTTTLGTSSSAASIPITLKQAKKLGVLDTVASLTISLRAIIHLARSTSKITAFVLAIMITSGVPLNPIHFTGFALMLGVTMIAIPGVPGDVVMAATGILSPMLEFDEAQVNLMITSYIVLNSFGTATNVVGNSATSLIVTHLSDGELSKHNQRIAASLVSEDTFDAQRYLKDVK